MKKIICFICILSMLISCTSCFSDEAQNDESQDTKNVQTTNDEHDDKKEIGLIDYSVAPMSNVTKAYLICKNGENSYKLPEDKADAIFVEYMCPICSEDYSTIIPIDDFQDKIGQQSFTWVVETSCINWADENKHEPFKSEFNYSLIFTLNN